MKYSRRIHRSLSEGQGGQLFLLLAIVFIVLAILFGVGRVLGDVSWQKILAIFLDPGVWGGEGSHDWFRILIAILGVFLFSGMLVTLIINIVENVSGAYKRGETRYDMADHILIIGTSGPLMNMLTAIRNHPVLSGHEILVMTTVDVASLRARVLGSLDDRSFCRKITYYHCSREIGSNLQKACASKAYMIYLLGEDNEPDHDSLNIKCLDLLKEICSGEGPTIQCFVTLEMHSSLDIIRYKKERVNTRLCIDVVNKSDYIVEQLLVHTDVLPALSAHETGKRVRIVIIGNSRIGRSFSIIASQICHYPNFSPGTRTQIVFVDSGMRAAMDDFVAGHEGVFDICHYHYVSPEGTVSYGPKEEIGDFFDIEWTFVDAQPTSLFAQDLLKDWISRPEEKTVIAVCYQDDSKSISTALHLPRQVLDSDCPVLVYQEYNSALVDEAKKTGMFGGIAAFGEGIPDFDALFLQRTTWGKRINRIYDLAYGNPPAQDEDAAWKRLSHAHKLSSIASANSMPLVLRSFGLALSAEAFAALDDETLECISEVEHRRWMSSVLMLGYFPASKELRQDRSRFKYLKNERFIHLDIAPYEELASEKDKDRLIVSKIPYVLTGEQNSA